MPLSPHAYDRNGGGISAAVNRRTNSARAGRPSVAGAILREFRPEFLHDRRRINASLLDAFGPFFLERLRGLLPFSDLRGRRLVDLLACLCLDFGDAGVFEIGAG